MMKLHGCENTVVVVVDATQETCARICKEQEADKTYSVVDLFRSPRLRNITILLIIIW